MAKTYNVLKHDLVPEHQLLKVEEEEEVLEKYSISKGQLPKISLTDPTIKLLEAVNDEKIEEGRIIRIVRKSETAQEFIVYRLVVKG